MYYFVQHIGVQYYSAESKRVRLPANPWFSHPRNFKRRGGGQVIASVLCNLSLNSVITEANTCHLYHLRKYCVTYLAKTICLKLVSARCYQTNNSHCVLLWIFLTWTSNKSAILFLFYLFIFWRFFFCFMSNGYFLYLLFEVIFDFLICSKSWPAIDW